LDLIVSPGHILPRKANNKIDDLLLYTWASHGFTPLAVYHDILEFSARVLVTDGIEFQNGPMSPIVSCTSDEFTSSRGRSLG